MSKLFEELQLKFSVLDTKIEEKKVFVENLCTEQQDLLKEHFDENSLSEKYSTEMNKWRQRLLEEIWSNLKLRMDHIDELVRTNGQNAVVQIYFGELKKTKRINFNRGVIRSGNVCIWRLILKEFKFGCKFSASQLIKYQRFLGIREYFFQRNGICDWDELLLRAIRQRTQNLEIARLMIEGGANPDSKNEIGFTALMYASAYGYYEIVKCLVENGADLNATALIFASYYGRFGILKYLFENGADVNGSNKDNETVLMTACERGHFEIVKYLVENGADLNVKNKHNKTALIFSSENGHLEIVKYLVDKGADFNAKYLKII